MKAFSDRYGDTVYYDGGEDKEVVDWDDDPVESVSSTPTDRTLDGLRRTDARRRSRDPSSGMTSKAT
jgi:hypothetical protein